MKCVQLASQFLCNFHLKPIFLSNNFSVICVRDGNCPLQRPNRKRSARSEEPRSQLRFCCRGLRGRPYGADWNSQQTLVLLHSCQASGRRLEFGLHLRRSSVKVNQRGTYTKAHRKC